ncbi:MAG: hypothetical protein NTX64_18070 [Elusimicrobia bacterium]|nr:hypothetical protein [Elusimicrobiota bacterium]
MRILLLLLLAAALLAPAARAQETPSPESPPPGQESQPDQDQGSRGSPNPDAPAPEEPAATGPVDFNTAKENFPGLVEAYISEHTVNDAMPFKDKTKRVWKLELQSVDIKTFKKLKENLFTACVLMREGADKLDLDFTVDFSGDHWHVSSINLHKLNGKPRFNYKGSRRVAVP